MINSKKRSNTDNQDDTYALPHYTYTEPPAKFSPYAIERLGRLTSLAASLSSKSYAPVARRPFRMQAPGMQPSAPGPAAPCETACLENTDPPAAAVSPRVEQDIPITGTAEPTPPETSTTYEETQPEQSNETEAGLSQAEAFSVVPGPPKNAHDELAHTAEMRESMKPFSPLLPPDENGGKALPKESRGLLHYKKWWFLRPVDVHVGGEMLSGTPIFIEHDTIRLVNKSYSHFIPLSKIDFIRTRDGLGDGAGL